MPRPFFSVLRCTHPLQRASHCRPHFLASIPLCGNHRPTLPLLVSASASVRTMNSRKKRKKKPPPPAPLSPWWAPRTHCSGCGIKLQSTNRNAPGYIYRKQDATNDRKKEWRVRKNNIDEMFDRVYKGVRGDVLKKLENTQDKVKEMEDKERQEEVAPTEGEEDVDVEGMSGLERMEQEWAQEQLQGAVPGEEQESLKEDTHSHNSTTPEASEKSTDFPRTDPRKSSTDLTSLRLDSSYDPKSAPLCRRCHEITYHSNPLLPQIGSLPPSKPITQILSEIASQNRFRSNPPLLIHVLDVADFPLSFIPFAPPRGSKILYVINRADVVCERSSSMGHVRTYFREELERILKEEGIRGMDTGERGDRGEIGVEVHPVSALKGWGIKELLARIFQLRNAESNVYLIGHTNVGKSSIIAALFSSTGISKHNKDLKLITPTISIFPHTTLASINTPLSAFRAPRREDRRHTVTRGNLIDTPGIEGDATFLNGLIMEEYRKSVSLLKRGGFQRPAMKMEAGQTLLLGGMIRIDLLSCTPHPQSIDQSSPAAPHIRLTPLTNLPPHRTSPEKATQILSLPPAHFMQTKSIVEVVTSEAQGPNMQTALELDIKSTGNSERNTIEIVFAGLGFVAIGGNFGEAKVRVETPRGRGVGVRKPVVQRIMGGFSLDVVRRKKVGRLILQRKDWGRSEDGRFNWEVAKEKMKEMQGKGKAVQGSGDGKMNEMNGQEIEGEMENSATGEEEKDAQAKVTV